MAEVKTPLHLKLWICGHCMAPRLYGSRTDCGVCGSEKRDIGDYHLDAAAPPVPEDARLSEERIAASEGARELVAKAISKCYEPTSTPLAEGTQQLDGQWLMPLWGCDTLDHLRDALTARVEALTAEVERQRAVHDQGVRRLRETEAERDGFRTTLNLERGVWEETKENLTTENARLVAEKERLGNAFLMAYDLAGIDATPLPEALPESAYVPGYMDKVRELREVRALLPSPQQGLALLSPPEGK